MSSFKIWNGPPVTSEPWLTDFLTEYGASNPACELSRVSTNRPFLLGATCSLCFPLQHLWHFFWASMRRTNYSDYEKTTVGVALLRGDTNPTKPKLGAAHWAPTDLICSKAAWYKPSTCWPGPACWLPAVSKLWDVVTCTTTVYCSHQSCCCNAAGQWPDPFYLLILVAATAWFSVLHKRACSPSATRATAAVKDPKMYLRLSRPQLMKLPLHRNDLLQSSPLHTLGTQE